MKTISKPSVTIGIPAYNEQENIGNLLEALIRQNKVNYHLVDIIVSSDNSSDNTVPIVKRYAKHGVSVIDNSVREGQATRQNQIINLTHSDILVLLNADIMIEGGDFIWRLIEPIVFSRADLTSSNLRALPSSTFVGRMLNTTLKLRNNIFEQLRNGQNIYTCHGAARGLSRKFYRHFLFDGSTAEDAYSYLSCVTKGFTYKFVPSAMAYIKWSDTLVDHYRQSLRFFQSKNILINTFGTEIVTSEYNLPRIKILLTIVHLFVRHPLEAFVYTAIYSYSLVSSIFIRPVDTWIISQSSKKLT